MGTLASSSVSTILSNISQNCNDFCVCETPFGQFICACPILKLCVGGKSSSVVILKFQGALAQMTQKRLSMAGEFSDRAVFLKERPADHHWSAGDS